MLNHALLIELGLRGGTMPNLRSPRVIAHAKTNQVPCQSPLICLFRWVWHFALLHNQVLEVDQIFYVIATGQIDNKRWPVDWARLKVTSICVECRACLSNFIIQVIIYGFCHHFVAFVCGLCFRIKTTVCWTHVLWVGTRMMARSK